MTEAEAKTKWCPMTRRVEGMEGNKIAVGQAAFNRVGYETTEIKWEVDHIVPIKSKIVCGLHTEQNLRIVPRRVNRSKNNRYWPQMPEARN